ncbi:MAG: hypothetical protein CMJ83_16545 [Planctomycetes bacterium]|nr:hypothetical protein [Planctomycetota bacterium]
MATKTKASKAGKPKNVEDKPVIGESGFDKWMDDVRDNPVKWMVKVVILVAVVCGGFFAWNYFTEKSEQDRQDQWDKITRTFDASTSVERYAVLTEVVIPDDADIAPYYWFLRSKTAYDAAFESEKIDDKIAFLKSCNDDCATLINNYKTSAWVSLPWKSSRGRPEPAPSLARRIQKQAQAQYDWLVKHRTAAPPELTHDKSVLATLNLKDVEDKNAKTYTLKIRVYSAAAPYAVDNFLEVIRRGWWKGKHVYGAQEDDPNTTSVDAVLLGSAFSKLADRSDVHGTEDDWVGWTLPIENSSLTAKSGMVAFDLRREANAIAGGAPAKLVIYTSDDVLNSTDRIIFGEVEDSSEAMDWLKNIGFDNLKTVNTGAPGTNVHPLKLKIGIADITVEGAPDSPPATPLPHTWTDPKDPDPLPKKDDEGEGKEDGAKKEGGAEKDKEK